MKYQFEVKKHRFIVEDSRDLFSSTYHERVHCEYSIPSLWDCNVIKSLIFTRGSFERCIFWLFLTGVGESGVVRIDQREY